MPIVALSDSAARAIRSTLALNDAISVTKELIDNALDSKASNITIEISANTLDIIQVKDNGGGIGVEDRQLLCKQGFTSKIRTLEDLSQLGGTFLGFRGEALASIANLSDSTIITTRVDGETVGTWLKFDSNGKLISSSSAAHGTGTTVRVADFLKSIPVRKQTALKQATKTLHGIKKLLFDYAFARPTVRFQFKVLKSGGDLKANWSFAPCNDASNLSLLTSKIVGKEVAAQCKQFTVTSDDGEHTIDGCLFARDSGMLSATLNSFKLTMKDISRCGGTERFVSIDGRPLAVERGLFGDINKMYKSYIASTLPDGISVPNKIFLLLRLQCPRGSYDVNIEPAKNEVMFGDSELILDLFEKLCKIAYGEKEVHQKTRKEPSKKQSNQTVDFDVLLARKTPTSTLEDKDEPVPMPPETPTRNEQLLTHSGQTKNKKVFNNMFDVDDEGLPAGQDEEHILQDQESMEESEDIMDPKVFNPFVLAKLNTIQKPPTSSPSGILTLTPGREKVSNDITSPKRDNTNTPRVSHQSDLLPSPSPSPETNIPYQNPGPPNRPWKTRQNREEADEDDASSPLTSAQPIESTRPTMLDNWATRMNSSSPRLPSSDTIEIRRSEPIVVRARAATGPMSSTSPQKSPSKRSVGPSSGQQSAFQTPFKKNSNLQGSSSMSFDRPAGPSVGKSPEQSREPISPADTTITLYPGFERPRVSLDSELDEIMDFEHRKRSTILEHRKRVKQPKLQSASRVADQAEEEPTFSVPARPEKEGIVPVGQDVKYGSKFGARGREDDDYDIPPQPNSAGYTQNPHSNRAKKAIRDLEERSSGSAYAANGAEATDIDGNDDMLGPGGKGEREQQIKMSPKDPRAYLIRRIEGQAGTKKISTSKLPFEMIEPELGTHTFIKVIDSEETGTIEEISCRTKELSRIDIYVHSGSISFDVVEGNIPETMLQELEGKLHGLMSGADAI